MSRWNKKKRRWLVRKARQNRKKKKSIKTYGSPLGKTTQRFYSRNDRPFITQTPPRNFSLINNTEETMEFFSDFAREIAKKQYGTHFYVDSRNVTSVTVDALIYLIAILQNDKQNNNLNYSFSGNFPDSEEARKVYTECGFTDYVDSKMKVLPSSTDRMRIVCGTDNNPMSARIMSDFVIESLGKEKKDIQPLQKVLVELMSNVYYHAYEKNAFLAKKWYMYAERGIDFVTCVFVDTGYGIARTARKKLTEKIKNKVGLKVDDAKIIKSIFNREFRTSTGESYRGNGLVSVCENVRSELFEGFQVLSGQGRCIIPKDSNPEEIITCSYTNKLYGTVYQFIIR